jgi:hypothetical protein
VTRAGRVSDPDPQVVIGGAVVLEVRGGLPAGDGGWRVALDDLALGSGGARSHGAIGLVACVLGFPIVRDSDGEIDVLGEPRLGTERHRQAADDGPPGSDGLKV